MLPQRDPGGSAPFAAWEPLSDFPVGRLSFPISLHKQKTDTSFPNRRYHFSFPNGKTLLNSNSVTNSLNTKSLFVVQNTSKAFIPAMHLVILITFPHFLFRKECITLNCTIRKSLMYRHQKIVSTTCKIVN